jgi:hypothetical protein
MTSDIYGIIEPNAALLRIGMFIATIIIVTIKYKILRTWQPKVKDYGSQVERVYFGNG